MLYNRVYNALRKSPNIMRKPLYLIPIETRLGGHTFIEMYSFLQETNLWEKEKLQAYQRSQLRELLTHAVKNVPFYSDISLSSADPFENLKQFPIIDKEIIQHQPQAFLASTFSPKNTYHVTTGGTSGNPLRFYLDNSTFGKEWAFKTTGWKRVGFKPGDKVMSFRGVEFKQSNRGIYWQDNPIYNMLEMSPFHMNDETLPVYIEKIRKFKPKFLHGYPSALSILAKYIDTNGEMMPPISAVLAISENIYSAERDLLERVFATRVFSFYGMSEKVILAPECEVDTRYHAFPEYGVTEIVDEQGEQVGEGERGELVGTGFLNHCMPFIRYRTGDYAVYSRQTCQCKRNHVMLEDLRGKEAKELMIVGKSGALFAIHTLYFTIHADVFRYVYRIQFHQRHPGEIILRIVPQPGFSDNDKKRILTVIENRVGNDLEVLFELVEEMELTERGKTKLLIQEVKVNNHGHS